MKPHASLAFLLIQACTSVPEVDFVPLPPATEFYTPQPYLMPRTQVVSIQDTKTGREYELYIKLPEDYSEKPGATFPVVYATDAAWHMDMLSGVTEYLMPEVILVGISWQTDFADERAFASRFRDFTPLRSETALAPNGEAENHLAFIRDDVIRIVEAKYRANPDERTYFGYSLGAAFGAFVLLEAPDTFSRYILGSPALSERKLQFLNALEVETANAELQLEMDVFVSLGELETDQKLLVEGLVTVLQRRRATGLNLFGIEYIEDADHSAAFPETVIRSVKWLSD